MKFILILTTILFIGCTDDAEATRVLRAQGFIDIQITGYEPFACGEDDTFSTGFRAKNIRNEVVTGVVCCGLVVKNCTIRY